jgi:acetylornithine deacetylase
LGHRHQHDNSMDIVPFCGQLCPCGKVAATLAGDHSAARRRKRQPAFTTFLLPAAGSGAASASSAARDHRLSRIHDHILSHQRAALQSLWGVERPLSQPVAASAHECTVLMQTLIGLPSVNPDQMFMAGHDLSAPEVASIVGEGRVVDWLAERIEAAGGETIVLECGDHWTTESPSKSELRRPNIIGVWRSSNPDAPWYAIDAHVDTVMVVGMEPFEPFSGDLTSDGKIHGRGSCDTKAAFACLLSLLHDLQASAEGPLDLPVNLVVCGTAGEETGRLGAHVFRDWLKAQKICAKEMLVTEPSLCTPVFAHKGTVRLQFHVNGVAAHSSKPHLGKNAVVAAAQLTKALWAEHQSLQSRGGPLGPPTLTPTIAEGGHGPNIVPQHASVACDYRVTTLPDNDTISEDVDEVVARLTAIAHATLDDNPHCESFQVVQLGRETDDPDALLNADGAAGNPAFYQDPNIDWVGRMKEWTGLEPEVVTYGTNATGYDSECAEAILICGPGDIAQAHMADECVSPLARAGSFVALSIPLFIPLFIPPIIVAADTRAARAAWRGRWVEVEQLVRFKGILAQWLGVADQVGLS